MLLQTPLIILCYLATFSITSPGYIPPTGDPALISFTTPFTLRAARPGSPFDHHPVLAANRTFYIPRFPRVAKPNTFCPLPDQSQCPPGDQTAFHFLGTNAEHTYFLYLVRALHLTLLHSQYCHSEWLTLVRTSPAPSPASRKSSSTQAAHWASPPTPWIARWGQRLAVTPKPPQLGPKVDHSHGPRTSSTIRMWSSQTPGSRVRCPASRCGRSSPTELLSRSRLASRIQRSRVGR